MHTYNGCALNIQHWRLLLFFNKGLYFIYYASRLTRYMLTRHDGRKICSCAVADVQFVFGGSRRLYFYLPPFKYLSCNAFLPPSPKIGNHLVTPPLVLLSWLHFKTCSLRLACACIQHSAFQPAASLTLKPIEYHSLSFGIFISLF